MLASKTVREKRLEQMAEKGYLNLTPFEREARLIKSLESMKTFFSQPEIQKKLKEKEADDNQ